MNLADLPWVLWIAIHGTGTAGVCCSTMGQIEIPAITAPCVSPQGPGQCSVSTYDICKQIADANKNAAFSVTCVARPQ